jgi:hypothetical protein
VGKRGIVLSFDSSVGRYAVQIDGSEEAVKVQEQNLQKAGR